MTAAILLDAAGPAWQQKTDPRGRRVHGGRRKEQTEDVSGRLNCGCGWCGRGYKSAAYCERGRVGAGLGSHGELPAECEGPGS